MIPVIVLKNKFDFLPSATTNIRVHEKIAKMDCEMAVYL